MDLASNTSLFLVEPKTIEPRLHSIRAGVNLKRPAQNLNRWDSLRYRFVIHPVWEDGSCQHLSGQLYLLRKRSFSSFSFPAELMANLAQLSQVAIFSNTHIETCEYAGYSSHEF